MFSSVSSLFNWLRTLLRMSIIQYLGIIICFSSSSYQLGVFHDAIKSQLISLNLELIFVRLNWFKLMASHVPHAFNTCSNLSKHRVVFEIVISMKSRVVHSFECESTTTIGSLSTFLYSRRSCFNKSKIYSSHDQIHAGCMIISNKLIIIIIILSHIVYDTYTLYIHSFSYILDFLLASVFLLRSIK